MLQDTVCADITVMDPDAPDLGAQLAALAATPLPPVCLTADLGRWLAADDAISARRERLLHLVDRASEQGREAGRLAEILVATGPSEAELLGRAWHCVGMERLAADELTGLLAGERQSWLDEVLPDVAAADLAEELRQFAAPVAVSRATGAVLDESERVLLANVVALDADLLRLRCERLARRGADRADLRVRLAQWRTEAADRARLARDLLAGDITVEPGVVPSRLRWVLGPEAMAGLREAAGDDPALARLARVLHDLDHEDLGVSDPARGLGLLLDLAANPGSMSLVAADPDPLLLAAFVLERAEQGAVRLPLPPGRADDARRVELELPEGVRLVEQAIEVDCGGAVAAEATEPQDERSDRKDSGQAALKAMVMNNLQSTSATLAFLRDAKITSVPGLVEEVVNRTRNPQILATIATDRTLHSGFANRAVPLALLRSPVNVSVRILRRFVHVKYVSKIELKRMAVDKSGIRKDVGREIEKYLSSLA